MERLLVKNVKIKGLDRDVLLEGEKILRIATAIAPEPGDRTLEGEGMLAIPGLVDCHTHIDKSHLNDGGRTHFVHGTGAVKGGLTREQKALFTQEDVTQRAEKVLQTALCSGTLHLRTNCDVGAIEGLTGIDRCLCPGGCIPGRTDPVAAGGGPAPGGGLGGRPHHHLR